MKSRRIIDSLLSLECFVYSSSQLSKYFGISIKGIEYYERKGLIFPERIGNNKQRRFDLSSTYQLFMTKYLRQAGLDIDKTIQVLNSVDAIGKLSNLLVDLTKKQERINAISEVLSHNLNLLKKAQNGTFFEEVNSPVLKRLFLREMDEPHKSNQQQTLEYRLWNELMPISNASIRLKKEDILARRDTIEPEIGMLISKENFDKFNLSDSSRVTTIQSEKCLHTVLVGLSEEIETKKWLNPVRQYLRNKNLELNGDIITSMLLVLDNDNAQVRYDEAWIPIVEFK
ncbi:MerR family transcriptional regulator [Lactobacillus colini]